MERTIKRPDGIRLARVLLALGVFAFLLVFFLVYRPLTLDNMDDWTYISFTRRAMPLWNYWNPSRVLPEILMPFGAQLGVWFVLPFTGDYVSAVNIALNVVLCLLITLYICMAAYWLEKQMDIKPGVTVLLTVLFFILHFKSWMSPWIASQHLFYSWSLTTCYYYTVPALVNIVLVLMIGVRKNGQDFWQDDRLIFKGFLVATLYLAVFSNLFSSVILVAYAGCCALENAAKALIKKEKPIKWLKENALHIGIVLMWLISAVFELSGGRSRSLDGEESLIDRVKATILLLLETIERMEDMTFWLCTGLIVAGFAAAWFLGRREKEGQHYLALMMRHLFCAGVTLLGLIVLCAASEPGYIERMDVLIGVVYHILLTAVLSLAYLIRRWKKLLMLVPLAVFIFGFDVLYGIDSFAHSTTWQIPAKTNTQINQALIHQIMDAENQGLETVTIKVPEGSSKMSNWPYTTNIGGRMLSTLKNHGIVEHLDAIYVEPDPDFYSEFGIE